MWTMEAGGKVAERAWPGRIGEQRASNERGVPEEAGWTTKGTGRWPSQRIVGTSNVGHVLG